MLTTLRVVLDTSVVLAAKRSQHPESPNGEILDRWQRREFAVLLSLDTLAEYAEKLLEHGISASEVETFLRLLARHATHITISFFHFRHYPVDPEDVMFLLCAMNGQATHLVSYDEHLLALAPFYSPSLEICLPLQFLTDCRNAIRP